MFAAALLVALTPPQWWLSRGGAAEEWRGVQAVADAISMAPRDMFTSDLELTSEAARRYDALSPIEQARLDGGGDPLALATKNRSAYLANVRRMGQAPDPDVLAIYDEAVRRAGGKPDGNEQATMPPQQAASVPSSRPSAGIAVGTPSDRRPTAAFMTGRLGFGPYGTSSYDLSVTYLFPSGYAVDEDCVAYDPLRAAPTPDGVARAGFEDCELIRARRVGGTLELWDEGEWWAPDGTTPIIDEQARPGERLDLTVVNEDGFDDPTGSFYSASGTSQGCLTLTPDGRIETNYTARMDVPDAVIAGEAITLGTRAIITTDTPVRGRYHLDGHVITIALDGGGVVQQLFTLTRDADTDEIDGAFFGGQFYWVPD